MRRLKSLWLLDKCYKKNPFAKLRFALRFGLAALACSQTFSLLSVSLRSLACGFFLSCMSFFLQKIDEQSLFLIWGAGPRLRRGAARGGISYLLRPLYVACKPSACVPPQMGFAHLGFPGSSSGVKDSDRKYVMIVRIQFGKYIAGCGSMRKPTT